MIASRARYVAAPRRAFVCALAVALVAFGAWLAGCGKDSTQPEPDPDPPFFPTDYEQTYTEVRDCRFSIEHDGWNITVHANDLALDDYVNGTYPLSEGAVLVKTLHRDDQCNEVVGYVAMEKKEPGFSPSSNDWAWQELDAARVAERTGVLASCISCHTSCTNGRDLTCTDP